MSKTHDSAIDFLRVISILAVVLIHTTTRHLEIVHYDLINNSFALLLNQVSRFAVPLFFLVSGFVLELNYKKMNYLVYLKKRTSRILIPYLIWSIIYYYFIYTNHTTNFLKAILTGSASYQLYFVPSLFIFYLIFPLIHRIYFLISNKLVLIILAIIELFLLHTDYQTHTSILPYPVAVFLFNYFVFVLGMIFSRNRESFVKIINRFKLILFPLTLWAGFYVFNEGKTNYLKTYNFEAFYSQWRPSVLIYTILISSVLYLFATKVNLKFLKKISDLSFSVFFIHVIILEFIWKYFVTNDVLFFAVTAIFSFLAAYLISIIPITLKSILKKINHSSV